MFIIGRGISGLLVAYNYLTKTKTNVTIFEMDVERKHIVQQPHAHVCMSYMSKWLFDNMPRFEPRFLQKIHFS